jgi:hypothetical protein
MCQIDAKELHAAFSQGDCNKIGKEIATKCAGKLVGREHDRDGYFPKWTILGHAEDTEIQLGIPPPSEKRYTHKIFVTYFHCSAFNAVNHSFHSYSDYEFCCGMHT